MSRVRLAIADGHDDASTILLRQWSQSATMPFRLVQRSRIVLMALEGYSIRHTAAALRLCPRTVALWRERFREGGPEALTHDAPGRGRKPRVTSEAVASVLASAPSHAPRPSLRVLAARLGVSKSALHRALRRRP
jgi:transposase